MANLLIFMAIFMIGSPELYIQNMIRDNFFNVDYFILLVMADEK
jgi:hypothetical protein